MNPLSVPSAGLGLGPAGPYQGGRRGAQPPVPSGTKLTQSDDLMKTDTRMRADLQQLAAKAGPKADVTVEYRYQVGTDGQLYVVGGKVTTTEKVNTEDKAALVNQAGGQPGFVRPAADTPPGFPRSSINISPNDQAALFSLNADELAHVKKLQSIDAQVRGHEAQHFRAAGGLAQGGPEFTFIQGPDGGYYAVGGQVNVKTSNTTDEGKASRDAATLANAATAPADTSAQDIAAARQFYNRTASLFQSAANQRPVHYDVPA